MSDDRMFSHDDDDGEDGDTDDNDNVGDDYGDVDGDQDVDVVLGGGYISVGLEAYPQVVERLSEFGEPVLILKNTLN